MINKIKKVFMVLCVFVISLCLSCDFTNKKTDSFNYSIVPGREDLLGADIDIKYIRVSINLRILDYDEPLVIPDGASIEEKEQIMFNHLLESNKYYLQYHQYYIKAFNLQKYDKYRYFGKQITNSIGYKFEIGELTEDMVNEFKSLVDFVNILGVSIYNVKDCKYDYMFKLNPDYYGFKEENKVDFCIYYGQSISYGVYSSYSQFIDAYKRLSINNTINTEGELYKICNENFFEDYALISIRGVVDDFSIYQYLMDSIYIKDGKMHVNLKIGIGNGTFLPPYSLLFSVKKDVLDGLTYSDICVNYPENIRNLIYNEY